MPAHHFVTSLVAISFLSGLSTIAGVLPSEAAEPQTQAIIDTKFGAIGLTFFPDKAPKHVESFINLIKSGFYNGTIFHRVIPGFVIQGGDPNTKGGSQFFIVVAPVPQLDGKYTVFGQVTTGMEVVDQIVAQPRDARDMPHERIEMTIRLVDNK
jgi:peptidyl-prolyl cis-trans isomerase B (cyclophilin B)